MTSSMLPQLVPLASNLELDMEPSVPLLGLSAGLGDAGIELQKLLTDERMKSETHRTNYETLKAEHTSLQNEFTLAQNELKRLLKDKQAQHESMQLLIAELRTEQMDRNRELSELRLQVMTPQRLEMLRAQVQLDMEGPVRERFAKLEEENEKYRTNYNKVRYELIFLKTEFDHQRDEHEHVLEEQKLRYEAEISHLEKNLEDLHAQYHGTDLVTEGKRVEALLREKSQLHLRLKALETETAELRAQRENYGQQNENVQRIQIRQISESQATIKSLEAERQSLRLRLERLDRELSTTREENDKLTTRLHKAEREVNALTSQMDSLKHSNKLDLANVKLECARSRGEMERERDALQGQIEGLHADVHLLKSSAERHKEILKECERASVRKVQAAREEEIRKAAVLHEEKLELEARLAALERQRALQDAEDLSQKEDWEERLKNAQQGEELVRREVQSLRIKLQQQIAHQQELEQQKADFSDLQQQNQDFHVQLATLAHLKTDLTEENQRLKESLSRVREELKTTRAQTEKSQHHAERLVEERQIEWLEEKHKLKEREAKLLQKYEEAKERMKRASVAQKKRRTYTENCEKKLQDKIDLLEAKCEELQLELEVAKKRPLHSEEETQLRRKLKELQRRHDDFYRLLMSGPNLQTSPAALLLDPEGQLSNRQDEQQHLLELAQLRHSLEELENVQEQQLEHLGSLVQKKAQPSS
ncbi:centrosomal protein of 83 kDa [Neosynchiropus ocellatus]